METIQYDCFRSFFKIVQQMKESNFKAKFNTILRITWRLVLRAQPTMQERTGATESVNESAVELEGIHLHEGAHTPTY